jgi:gamma-glutamylcyclotransferase (GGCT)/AIG2-like uncharacterized protein YtfP
VVLVLVRVENVRAVSIQEAGNGGHEALPVGTIDEEHRRWLHMQEIRLTRADSAGTCVWYSFAAEAFTMPLLFSYGTLQQQDVQLSTFGRLLEGVADELPGYEVSSVQIDDPEVVATTAMTHYANVLFNGRNESRVSGTVFEVTDGELAAADDYEAPAGYERIAVRLASGKQVSVYRHPTANR